MDNFSYRVFFRLFDRKYVMRLTLRPNTFEVYLYRKEKELTTVKINIKPSNNQQTTDNY